MDRQRTGGWGGEESKLTIELGRVWGYREIDHTLNTFFSSLSSA